MAYRVEIERRAHKVLSRLLKGDRVRLVAAIDALAEELRPSGCVAVRATPTGTYRIRVGHYRVIYVVLDDEPVIVVARAATRREATYREPN